MTTGQKFIRSAIEAESTALIRAARRDFFTEEELPLIVFVQGHLAQYNRLPNDQAFSDAQLTLPQFRRGRADEGPDYALDRLAQRFAHRSIAEHMPTLRQSMEDGRPADALQAMRDAISDAAPSLEHAGHSTMAQEVVGVQQDYEFARDNPGLAGVTLGWQSLDDATNGAQGGDLVVVAGRPGMGKSWVLVEMAYQAWRAGRTPCFVSMEMGLRQVARRWIGRHTGVNPNRLRTGELSSWGEGDLRDAVPEIRDGLPVYLMAGDMSKSVGGIDAMVGEFRPEILYVDAAYLLSPSSSARSRGYVSKWEEIAMVIRELKQMAIRFDIPIVLSVQFNRNQKKRSNKALDLGDIAGSDSIPQDASIVLGVRQGQPPFQERQRVIEGMKNREGMDATFAINFGFDPVDMSETEFIEQTEGETQPAAPVDNAWMI